MSGTDWHLFLMPVLFLVTTPGASSQPPAWEVHTRLLASSSSHSSEPAGFTAYSTFPLEIGVRRQLGTLWRIELSARSESRELDQAMSPTAVRVGSFEALPLNLLAQFRFNKNRGFRPYVGGGLNATIVWEKAGTIDSMNVSPSMGPALQVGADVRLNSYMDLNLDYRWNTWSTTIESHAGTRLCKLTVDPSAFGLGLAVHF